MTTKSPTMPTLDEFKALAGDIAPVVSALLVAQAHAEHERARVNQYIRPVFDRYTFMVAERFRRAGEPTQITEPENLYLCDDDALCRRYYDDCDAAHRAHGFTGPKDHCPALVAENLVLEAERALMEAAQPLLGIDPNTVYGENRKKYLKLLIGAAVQSGKVDPKATLRRVLRKS